MNSDPGYPYPEREHFEEPHTPAELIRNEMKYGGEGKDMRTSILRELGGLYGGSNLARSFYGSSDALAWYYTEGAEPHDTRRENLRQLVYSGQLLSLEVGLNPIEKEMKEKILSSRLTGLKLVEDDDLRTRTQEAFFMLHNRVQFDMYMQQEALETRLALNDFADRMLSDYSANELEIDYRARSDDIIFGYVFGTHAITALERYIRSRDDTTPPAFP